MSDNAALIEEAREWAEAALPPEPWRFGHVSLRLADALEAAEAERDAALAVIERVRGLLGYGIGVRLDAHEGGGVRIMVAEDAIEEALESDA